MESVWVISFNSIETRYIFKMLTSHIMLHLFSLLTQRKSRRLNQG